MSAPWISGSVFVDLTDVAEDKARMRVYRALVESPEGARVVVHVGPLAVNWDVLQVVWEYGRHVAIEVSGHARAVALWVEALRNGLEVVA
ncbi:hypothetical protein [Nocardioides caldifontis]|uniref:hypothetical protein n=1 Tax=Nocardioides caldifontis TaxID=2588938 RepID=UPI0011E02B5E|nr:hypothetical protein [Nocardioides caldifontis]